MEPAAVEEMFRKLDVHKNGDIHYSEFLAAYDSRTLVESPDAIRRAFAMSRRAGMDECEAFRPFPFGVPANNRSPEDLVDRSTRFV